MKQVELAQQLGISKSYSIMILSEQRIMPKYLEKPLSELIHKTPIQAVCYKQCSPSFSLGRDAKYII